MVAVGVQRGVMGIAFGGGEWEKAEIRENQRSEISDEISAESLISCL